MRGVRPVAPCSLDEERRHPAPDFRPGFNIEAPVRAVVEPRRSATSRLHSQSLFVAPEEERQDFGHRSAAGRIARSV